MKWGSYIEMNIVNDILNLLNINGFDKPCGTDKASEHSYDRFYSKEFESSIKQPKILEIGSYTGGSILLWSTLLDPSHFVSIDIQDNIDKVVMSNMSLEKDCVFDVIIDDAYNPKKDTVVALRTVGDFDYIFEDGSHELKDQIYVLKNYSEMLSYNTGAALYIEDIQSIENAQTMANVYSSSEYLKTNFDFTIFDLRHVKNRYDDIIVKVTRK